MSSKASVTSRCTLTNTRAKAQSTRPIDLFEFYFTLFAIISIPFNSLAAEKLVDRMNYWDSKAFLCEEKELKIQTPSKPSDNLGQPCDDGDMTLFNGLLCYADDERGCVGVAEAQDPVSGKWDRSPRIRLLGKNDRGNSDFSPDMALGVELYLIKKKDTERARKWLLWIHENSPCALASHFSTSCLLEGIPRFCTDNAGCYIRPGDAAALSTTVDYLQKYASLPPLPDGRLRGYLGILSGYGPFISSLDFAP